MADQVQPAAPPQPTEKLVNVFSPEGELQSLPESQLDDATQSGYTEATPQDYEKWSNEQKFGTPAEQLKTFGEGAAQAATFGLSTGLEKAMGVSGRNIRLREETNPVSHGAGQVAGLVAPSLVPGLGEISAGRALEAAGSGATEALGLTGANAASQIGSAAVKGAVETAMLTGGDEVSKMFAGDPNQSAQTALTNIGLSGLLGSAFGAGMGSVSPLWEATLGPKATQLMDMLTKKSQGMDGIISDATSDALQTAGVEIPGEMKAVLSDIPSVSTAARNLAEASTFGGTKMGQAINEFKGTLSNGVLDVFGKSPEEVMGLKNLSDAQAGTEIKNSLENTLREQIEPISNKLNSFNEQFKDATLTPEFKNEAQLSLDSLIKKEQWNSAAFKDERELASTISQDMANLSNASDIKKYIENLSKKYPFGSPLYYPAKQMKSILSETQEKAVAMDIMNKDMAAGVVSGVNPEKGEILNKSLSKLDDYQNTRAQYGDFKGTLEDLNDRLHVGKYGGPEGFFQALKEMTPEQAVSRLAKTNDADLLNLLQENFPDVAEKVKQYHINNLLESASRRASGEETINSKVLFSALDKMSPEMREFILPPESANKLNALQSLIENEGLIRKNPSGTGGVVDSLLKSLPNPAVGMATSLLGAGPGLSLAMSAAGNYLFREGGDAFKLGLLRFIGNGQHISAGGLKGLVDLISNVIKGQNLVVNATKGIFKAGSQVLPEKLTPKQKDRDKLQKYISDIDKDPNKMMGLGGKSAEYAPEYGAAFGQIASNSINFLKSVQPQPMRPSPLDHDLKITPAQKTQYNRYLDIAEQPLVVLNDVKNGTITTQDINAIETMHPDLYNGLKTKLTEEMVNHLSDGGTIPYKTRIGLSLFMKEPLDSTMQQPSIMNVQASFQPPPPPAPQMRQKHSMKDLGKASNMALTGAQAREERRSNA